MTDWISTPGGALRGEIRVPGDKSIAHRALMLAALADGTSRIGGVPEGTDVRTTARGLAQMGVRIDASTAGERVVTGVGMQRLVPPPGPLDCGNSGTGMRLLAGLLAGQAFDSTLTGDASLSRRPMRRVVDPLARMGAWIDCGGDGTPPLRIHGGRTLHGIDYLSPVASAQVKSALLLAGLRARGATTVDEPVPTRDHTERLLAAFHWPVVYGPGHASLKGGHRLQATDVSIPGDFSSAAFFITAATLVPGSDVLLRGVGINPRRTGLLNVLCAMGADIEERDRRLLGEEWSADLRVRHAALRGVEVPIHEVVDMIDELPILFVAAAVAEGVTTIRGAGELRVKESDRIATMARGLRQLGIEVAERPDGAEVNGGVLQGGYVECAGDHRVAMSLAVAGAVASAPVHIADCTNVATSFPEFVALSRECGMVLTEMAGSGVPSPPATNR